MSGGFLARFLCTSTVVHRPAKSQFLENCWFRQEQCPSAALRSPPQNCLDYINLL